MATTITLTPACDHRRGRAETLHAIPSGLVGDQSHDASARGIPPEVFQRAIRPPATSAGITCPAPVGVADARRFIYVETNSGFDCKLDVRPLTGGVDLHLDNMGDRERHPVAGHVFRRRETPSRHHTGPSRRGGTRPTRGTRPSWSRSPCATGWYRLPAPRPWLDGTMRPVMQRLQNAVKFRRSSGFVVEDQPEGRTLVVSCPWTAAT